MQLDSQSITQILSDLGPDAERAEALLPRVYDELRRLAACHFSNERPDHTLQPTALVNEAFLRLASDSSVRVESRSHFFRLASKVMRQILVDHARAKISDKRGGLAERLSISESLTNGSAGATGECDLLALEEALKRLATFSPNKARLVELRFFGGLTIEEAGEALGISRTQVTREWRVARAWLADELRECPAP